jgi:hypothetical protein
VDEDLGLCHVRVPTWLPCRLQICFNGHNWLAGQLRKLGIDYRMADNAFSHIADWQRAQRISHGWEAKRIHARLDEFAAAVRPDLSRLRQRIPLERGPVRIRHRHRLPQTGGSAGDP